MYNVYLPTSVQGRIERSRRNYTEVWEQISGHRRQHSTSEVANFRLNILGETVEAFSVPGGARELLFFWWGAGRGGWGLVEGFGVQTRIGRSRRTCTAGWQQISSRRWQRLMPGGKLPTEDLPLH